MSDPVGFPATPTSLFDESTGSDSLGGAGWTSLYDYGLIGNERTAALVSRDGAIDWACFPRFDSPSVFGRLLDRKAGGFHRVAPEGRYVSHQQYVGGTNLLSTLFELRRGLLLAVTDFMPVGPSVSADEGEPRIIRRLLARGGPIAVRLAADVRFNYALERAEWELGDRIAIARAPSGQLAVTSPWPWQITERGAEAAGTVAPGRAGLRPGPLGRATPGRPVSVQAFRCHRCVLAFLGFA